MELTFKNNKSGNGGFITMHKGDTEVGRLTYTIFPEQDKLVISFVNIYREFEGQGLGKIIIKNAIDFARKNDWKIYPHCSYANTVMHRMDDVKDILLKQ